MFISIELVDKKSSSMSRTHPYFRTSRLRKFKCRPVQHSSLVLLNLLLSRTRSRKHFIRP